MTLVDFAYVTFEFLSVLSFLFQFIAFFVRDELKVKPKFGLVAFS